MRDMKIQRGGHYKALVRDMKIQRGGSLQGTSARHEDTAWGITRH